VAHSLTHSLTHSLSTPVLNLAHLREITTLCYLLPKYHCELNFIEIVWGWLKAFHIWNCSYNFLALSEGLPNTIENVIPMSFIRRAARSCRRFGRLPSWKKIIIMHKNLIFLHVEYCIYNFPATATSLGYALHQGVSDNKSNNHI